MGKIKQLPPAKMSRPQGPVNPSELCVMLGNISRESAPEPKTTGIKMRGSGAATKGYMSRGPMG